MQSPDAGHLRRRYRLLKGRTNEALRRQIVNDIRFGLFQQAKARSGIDEVEVDQSQIRMVEISSSSSSRQKLTELARRKAPYTMWPCSSNC